MEAAKKHLHPNRVLLRVLVPVLAWASVSYLLTVQSYSHSETLTYSDVTLTVDEGLVSLLIPLTRLADGHNATSDFQIYSLHKENGWATDRWVTVDGSTRFRTREYLDIIRKSGQHETYRIGTRYGFGYVLIDQRGTSSSRPGFLLWLIVPIWSVIAACTTLISLLSISRPRVSLRALMILTAVAALLAVLPTLRAPA